MTFVCLKINLTYVLYDFFYFFLPRVFVVVGVGEKRFTGWHPISATSLQQSPISWQNWSQ